MIHVNQKSSNPWTDGACLGLIGIEPLDSDGAYFGLTKKSENQQRGRCSNHSGENHTVTNVTDTS